MLSRASRPASAAAAEVRSGRRGSLLQVGIAGEIVDTRVDRALAPEVVAQPVRHRPEARVGAADPVAAGETLEIGFAREPAQFFREGAELFGRHVEEEVRIAP